MSFELYLHSHNDYSFFYHFYSYVINNLYDKRIQYHLTKILKINFKALSLYLTLILLNFIYVIMNISSWLINNIGLLGLGIVSLGSSVFYVSAGENGILYNYLTKTFSTNFREGYHIRMPFITRPIIFETRTRFVEESSTTANKDLQKVNFTIRVLFRPDPKNLVSIFENLGLSYAEKVLNPLIKEISKAIIANYDAHELLS